ncbi:MAG: uridine diphosphate-N-acetylglucosamine-binding protein YvcK [Candidatus Brocadiales bacterium]
MRIKAVIFDLDDTLYDCTGLLVEASRRRAAKAMVNAGLPLSVEEAYKLQKTVSEKYGPSSLVFDEIAKMHGMDHSLVECALRAYNSDEVSDIEPFPDVVSTLRQLRLEKYKLFLVTMGVHRRQEKKLEQLGISSYFDEIAINDQEVGLLLEDCFRGLLQKYNLLPEEVAVVGDRVGAELRVAKTMGMFAIQMLHGRFKVELPSRSSEKPDYKIKRIYQLSTILELINMGKSPDRLRVLAIGGGTGLPIVLQGLKTYSKNLTAVVTVTDSGRSSGMLREQYGVLPPGDARNCLVALSETEEQQEDLYRLFQYRFNRGSLEGMSLGNLLMTALTDITGSFEQAIKKASKILAISGKVLPSTLQDTHICAELDDGKILESELNVRQPGKAPIKRVLLKPDNAEALPETLEEIRSADIIILGPGSLYTSVIPNILVRGISEAIKNSHATKIYVCNIVTQPGQTDGYTSSDHIRVITKHVGEGVLDYVLVNDNLPRKDILDRYEKEGAGVVRLDPDTDSLFVKVVEADLVEDLDKVRVLWEKQDLLRHDPDKLADAICKVYARMPIHSLATEKVR